MILYLFRYASLYFILDAMVIIVILGIMNREGVLASKIQRVPDAGSWCVSVAGCFKACI